MRIENHPILEFPQRETVQFVFDGKALEGLAGEPIAAALHAAGVRSLRHSSRFHRPRGLFCAIGNCSSCLMTVDGDGAQQVPSHLAAARGAQRAVEERGAHSGEAQPLHGRRRHGGGGRHAR